MRQIVVTVADRAPEFSIGLAGGGAAAERVGPLGRHHDRTACAAGHPARRPGTPAWRCSLRRGGIYDCSFQLSAKSKPKSGITV